MSKNSSVLEHHSGREATKRPRIDTEESPLKKRSPSFKEKVLEALGKIDSKMTVMNRRIEKMEREVFLRMFDPWREMALTDRSRVNDLRGSIITKFTGSFVKCWLTGCEVATDISPSFTHTCSTNSSGWRGSVGTNETFLNQKLLRCRFSTS